MKRQLEIGSEVAVMGNSGTTLFGRVEKITPTGQISVRIPTQSAGDSFIRRFKPNGYEMGATSAWRHAHIIDEEPAVVRTRLSAEKAIKDANVALRKIYVDPAPHAYAMPKARLVEELDRLQKVLDEVKAMVAGIQS